MECEDYLRQLAISFIEHKHGAVFTVEEARNDPVHRVIKGIHSKNLFLKTRKSARFFLLVMPTDKAFNISKFEKIVDERIKFANEQNLKELLGVIPGAVSPFGLLNDKDHVVELFIDEEVWNSDVVSFHPNDNARTLELKGCDFQKFVRSLGNTMKIIA